MQIKCLRGDSPGQYMKEDYRVTTKEVKQDKSENNKVKHAVQESLVRGDWHSYDYD